MTMNRGVEIVLRVTGDEKLAEEWELVLLARGLSPSLRRGPDGVMLSVPEAERDRAVANLSAYERENRRQPPAPLDPMESGGLLLGASVALSLLIFFFLTLQRPESFSWVARGSADAERIAQGELWRTVTALTLHADVVHALSNAIAAAVFFSAVASMVGPGLGSALVLLAGAGGNLLNAFMHGPPHDAVGASTAVFGAVGLLGSLGMARRRRRALSRRRAWLPMAAALALLGMLGSGGPRVDIWAHLFGLLVGALLGIPIAAVAPRAPGLLVQWTCGIAAVALLVYCWILAFR